MEDPSGSGGWRFAQCFGDKGEVEDITEGACHIWPRSRSRFPVFACFVSLTIHAADIISTVEFDSTGNYLATGDKGGRVVLFERNEMVCLSHRHLHPSHPPRPMHATRIVPSSAIPIMLLFLFLLMHSPEKGVRVQVLHRVPVARARVRLPQVSGDRGED